MFQLHLIPALFVVQQLPKLIVWKWFQIFLLQNYLWRVKWKLKIRDKQSIVCSTKQHRSKSATELWLPYKKANNGKTACIFSLILWTISMCQTRVAASIHTIHTVSNFPFHSNKQNGQYTHKQISYRFKLKWTRLRIIKEKQAKHICLSDFRSNWQRATWNFLHVVADVV